jgi:hypothetical protein
VNETNPLVRPCNGGCCVCRVAVSQLCIVDWKSRAMRDVPRCTVLWLVLRVRLLARGECRLVGPPARGRMPELLQVVHRSYRATTRQICPGYTLQLCCVLCAQISLHVSSPYTLLLLRAIARSVTSKLTRYKATTCPFLLLSQWTVETQLTVAQCVCVCVCRAVGRSDA